MMHPDPIRRLEAYRQRGMAFAVMNLVVLAAVFAFHLAYVELLGPPRMVLLGILFALFAVQLVLLFWHQMMDRMPDPRTDHSITMASIVLTIAGAFFASLFGEGEDHHYHVVMLPAIVLAAFRFRRVFAFSIAAASSVLMYYDVWKWASDHPPGEAVLHHQLARIRAVDHRGFEWSGIDQPIAGRIGGQYLGVSDRSCDGNGDGGRTDR